MLFKWLPLSKITFQKICGKMMSAGIETSDRVILVLMCGMGVSGRTEPVDMSFTPSHPSPLLERHTILCYVAKHKPAEVQVTETDKQWPPVCELGPG